MHCPPDKAHLATLTQLRERRLKLAPGQRSCDRYWQGHGWVRLYDPQRAVPMRAFRPPTLRQQAALAAGRALAGTFVCPGCRSRVPEAARRPSGDCPTCDDLTREADSAAELAAAWREARRDARAWLASDCLFVDVETSRLDDDAEIIELAVVDVAGALVLHTLIQPTQPVTADATAVHGIADADLYGAPRWPAVCAQFAVLAAGRHLVAHHAAFDRGRVAADCARHGLAVPAAEWSCSMALLTDINGGRWPGLDRAAVLADAKPTMPDGVPSQRHRAAYDATLCRAVVHALATGADAPADAPNSVPVSR